MNRDVDLCREYMSGTDGFSARLYIVMFFCKTTLLAVLLGCPLGNGTTDYHVVQMHGVDHTA